MKKGFTLVELIATLVVLSIVAIIVVPNIQKNIKEVQKGLYETQLQTIKGAAQSWAANNIEQVSSIDNGITYVFLKDLKNGGYIDEELYNNDEEIMFNDNVFVLITCHVIEETDNNSANYKYTYDVYETNEKHLTYLAKTYVENNNITNTTTVTLSDLLPLANENLKIDSMLKNIEGGTLISNASVVINYDEGNYTYEVNIID